MLARILPPEVVAVEAFEDDQDATLFPEEEAVIAAAVAKRRREFATVRACARAALARLGERPAAILPGADGAPVWPEGVAGSLTHCDGYRAAALARTSDVTTIGLDAEPAGPLPDGVLDLVATAAERVQLAALAARAPGTHWDRLLFSAKESVYKAWYPLARRWLGFEEAELTIDQNGGTFVARILVPGPVVDGATVTRFDGRWAAGDGLILTAITCLRRDRSGDR
ncbi:MAG TPA: 4'-phosphopantetheinyl transferase superfamily protein [Streptosporangiaceae bacterium]|nr:4'-phosphopantetheinyl transferase superfamily protein [Streptosporangiaceae bacterium]